MPRSDNLNPELIDDSKEIISTQAQEGLIHSTSGDGGRESRSVAAIQDAVLDPSADDKLEPSKPSEDVLQSLSRLEESLTKGIGAILEAFQEKLAYDRFKEDQITRLHDELQSYKSDFIAKITRPLINGVIRLHDDAGRMVEALEKRDPADLTPDRFFKAIGGFREDLEFLLSQNGVATYTELEKIFNPHRQKAMGTVATTEAEEAGHIAARLRPGFEQGSVILQKERVAVYVFSAEPPVSERDPEAGQHTGDEKQ